MEDTCCILCIRNEGVKSHIILLIVLRLQYAVIQYIEEYPSELSSRLQKCESSKDCYFTNIFCSKGINESKNIGLYRLENAIKISELEVCTAYIVLSRWTFMGQSTSKFSKHPQLWEWGYV